MNLISRKYSIEKFLSDHRDLCILLQLQWWLPVVSISLLEMIWIMQMSCLPSSNMREKSFTNICNVVYAVTIGRQMLKAVALCLICVSDLLTSILC